MKNLLILLFIASTSGIRLGCDFRRGHWGAIGLVYWCEVTSMDFSDDPINVSGYSGTHMSGFSSADLRLIRFGDFCPQFNLKTVPRNLLSVFPNLIGFIFVRCAFDVLHGNELDDYRNTEYWVISDLNITRIPGNFFASTPRMRVVGFNSSPITRVGDGLLDHLSILSEVWFSRNTCLSMSAPSRWEIPPLIEALRVNCPDVD